MMPIKRLSLTDFKCKIPRGAREKTLKKAMADEEVMKKWSETKWAKKLAAKTARTEVMKKWSETKWAKKLAVKTA